jgi:hypothetical protein
VKIQTFKPYLTLGEVEVYDGSDFLNKARGKSTTQSSNWQGQINGRTLVADSGRAVDGDTNTFSITAANDSSKCVD